MASQQLYPNMQTNPLADPNTQENPTGQAAALDPLSKVGEERLETEPQKPDLEPADEAALKELDLQTSEKKKGHKGHHHGGDKGHGTHGERAAMEEGGERAGHGGKGHGKHGGLGEFEKSSEHGEHGKKGHGKPGGLVEGLQQAGGEGLGGKGHGKHGEHGHGHRGGKGGGNGGRELGEELLPEGKGGKGGHGSHGKGEKGDGGHRGGKGEPGGKKQGEHGKEGAIPDPPPMPEALGPHVDDSNRAQLDAAQDKPTMAEEIAQQAEHMHSNHETVPK